MKQQLTSLPHTGIATFCKAPYVPDLTDLKADVAVLGIPFDAATGMRPGCRQAPRAIRDASTRFGFLGQRQTGYFDTAAGEHRMQGIQLQGVQFADVGDADVTNFNLEHNFKAVETLVGGVLAKNALPVVLGGDHSISYPVVRAFAAYAPLTVVLFDAHLDYRDEVMGQRYTNNSPFRRIQELGFVRQIITLGLRGIKSTKRELEETLAVGNLVVTAETIHETTLADVLASLPETLGDYYVSIDIDVLDPSIAPGTESPEAEGLSYSETKKLLQGIAKRGRLVGLDLVEVNPYLDHAELTQHMAAQLLIETIATRFA
jgi:agmatinase